MKTNLFVTAALSLSLCVASTAQTLPAYLPTDGLVGWWPFNGNANDESGNGNNGIVNGATLTIDRFENSNFAYEFNGSSFIEVQNSNSLQVGSQLTISVWVKYTSLAGSLNWVLQKGIGGGCPVDGYFMSFDNGGQGNPQFVKGLNYGYGANYCANIANQATFLDNTWHNIIAIYNPTVGNKLYFDGIEVIRDYGACDSCLIINSPTRPLYIGRSPSDGGFGWNGKLDDIAIYNRALSPEEITALYTGEPVNPPTACNPLPANLQNGLVGYWPFCGNANDESGNGNDGTVNGATLTEDRFGVANAAYSFDGVDDFIDLGNATSVNAINQDFSISYWINLNSPSTNSMVIASHANGLGGSGWRFHSAIRGDSVDSRFMRSDIIDWEINTTPPNSIELNQWLNIVVVRNENSFLTYINQELISNKQVSGAGINSPVTEAITKIGVNWPSSPSLEYLNGIADDIGIWNRALSPEEVQQLYTLNACTFTIYDTTNVTIYDTVSVSVSTTDTLIINTLITTIEPAQENTFLVYPNPASTQITINNGNVAILGGYTMRISNSLGQDVYNQNITQPQVTLDLSTWGGNGLYVLYIVDPQQNIVAVKQIVLQ